MNVRLGAARFCLSAALLGAAGGALAFADDDARRAILDLREQVKALETQLKNTQMNFVSRLDSLQNQNRMLTGRVEELSNALAKEQRSSRDLFSDLDQRLSKFEPQTVIVNGVSVTVEPKEKAEYEAAVEVLKNGEYKKAAAAFKAFSDEWKESPYRPDAMYWRASSLFATEQYKSTIDVQNQLIRTYPKHPRVPDAMVSVGSAQAALGNVKAASNTFNKVIRQYPDSEAAKTAKQSLQSIRR